MIIIILFLPLSLLLTTVEISSFNMKFYEKKFDQYYIDNETGLEKLELMEITGEMLDYLKGERTNLSSKGVFNEKEILHMEDVKDLFRKGFKIRDISILLSTIAVMFLVLRNKKMLGKSFIISAILYIVLIIFLIIAMYTDFDKYFDYFHEILFTNDLWLLDPQTDILIQMLPLGFFYSIAYKISTIFIIQLIIMLILGLKINSCYKKSL